MADGTALKWPTEVLQMTGWADEELWCVSGIDGGPE